MIASYPEVEITSQCFSVATYGGNIDVLEWLFNNNNNNNNGDSNNNDKININHLLRLASKKGDLKMVQYLHHRGANLNFSRRGGKTPLYYACSNNNNNDNNNNNIDVVKYLIG